MVTFRRSEPYPREQFEPYCPVVWSAGSTSLLPAVTTAIDIDLTAVLQRRQTRRVFKFPLDLVSLASLLWLCGRTKASAASGYGFDIEYRPHPSAGGTHPIHVLVQRSSGESWHRYDTYAHALEEVLGTESLADEARASAGEAVETGHATLLSLVAEPGKTAAKYEHSESLVWRDAGVLLGYLSLVSEALELSFCPLGMTGDRFVSPLDGQGKLFGVGMALVGSG